ncbi:hypothetical protein [Ornithinibacillus bavariensis]|uniref:DUF4375 domain-containing protein n=1 Tax=Ornithinibacillus bavariensis TaxID=545502 RepID=A0A919X8D9_9BACI|nr:hypothetical protein [Ornithinibacillus bavariensis]GIO27436.1 hypothetical protein J43TS3_20470 [Ornithinibacillus bavariensis]
MGQNYFKLQANTYREFQIEFGKVQWMYYHMTTDYNGFGHGIDYEHFEYERFFFATTDKELDDFYPRQMEILKQGALVALGCEVVDLLDEACRDSKVYNFITTALSNPTIEELPFEKEALLSMKNALEEEIDHAWTALPSGSILMDKLEEVYKRYVFQYFKDMYEEGKKGWIR